MVCRGLHKIIPWATLLNILTFAVVNNNEVDFFLAAQNCDYDEEM